MRRGIREIATKALCAKMIREQARSRNFIEHG